MHLLNGRIALLVLEAQPAAALLAPPAQIPPGFRVVKTVPIRQGLVTQQVLTDFAIRGCWQGSQ